MGGNALKQYETHRLDSDEYFGLVEEFESIFFEAFNFLPVLIQAYRQKETFGDADFLIDSSKLPENWVDRLKETYCLTQEQYVRNSPCHSIGWRNFQIDLIVTAHDDMKPSVFYFSYNDFGNIIGRSGSKLGVKIGHKGMSLVVRHRDKSDHILKEIFFSKEPHDVLDLLGLSIERYEQGFDTLEEMFEYVATSKYYDPEIYKLEHRSAVSRIRDRKRTTYSMFLEWSEAHPELAKYSFPEKSELGGYSIRMPYYETEVLTRFPFVGEEVNSVINDFEIDLRFKEVYNGRIVGEITGLARAALGEFMYHLKPIITKEVKIAWTNNPEIAAAYIKWEYDAWR